MTQYAKKSTIVIPDESDYLAWIFHESSAATTDMDVIPAKSRKAGREPGSRQRPREGGEPETK